MPEATAAECACPIESEAPLCVNLDGALVKSDTLLDSLAVLARRDPRTLLRTPVWALKGRAHVKARMASAAPLNVDLLPYNRALLEYLRDERSQGRRIYLATGADAELARRIAAHLGIFAGVISSDGRINMTGGRKLAELEARFATTGFDYVGNARPDLPVLRRARRAMVANPAWGLSRALKLRGVKVHRSFRDGGGGPAAFARAIRIHHWAKNALVFVPLLLAHDLRMPSMLVTAATFFCFCLVGSATYILNDLLDLEADRLHPGKCRRAFASGDISIAAGLAIALLFLAAAITEGAFLPAPVQAYLLLYLGLTVAYSLALKRIALLDVLVLSALYTIRILAGGAASGTLISPWLAAFSIFLFLSLAMVKRLSELQHLRERNAIPANGRGYLLGDIEPLRSFGTSSAYASVVVFALYISGNEVARLYRHPARLWLMTPLLIFWLSRVWLLASRGVLDEDPVVFALTDGVSLLVGIGAVLVALAAL
jgi:4-hydroxybenzoate polyprenyltransferase